MAHLVDIPIYIDGRRIYCRPLIYNEDIYMKLNDISRLFDPHIAFILKDNYIIMCYDRDLK